MLSAVLVVTSQDSGKSFCRLSRLSHRARMEIQEHEVLEMEKAPNTTPNPSPSHNPNPYPSGSTPVLRSCVLHTQLSLGRGGQEVAGKSVNFEEKGRETPRR